LKLQTHVLLRLLSAHPKINPGGTSNSVAAVDEQLSSAFVK
jgi:hypothetical protein